MRTSKARWIIGGAALGCVLMGCGFLIGIQDPETDPLPPVSEAGADGEVAVDSGVDGRDPCPHVFPIQSDGADDNPSVELAPLVFAVRETRLRRRVGLDAGFFDASTLPVFSNFGFDLDNGCTCETDLRGGVGSCSALTMNCDFEGGVDNGTGTLFDELLMLFPGHDLDTVATINDRIASGDAAIVMSLVHYNGTANDADVALQISLVTRPDGTANSGCVVDAGPRPSTDDGGTFGPAWDGCDTWHPGNVMGVTGAGSVVNHVLVIALPTLPVPIGGLTVDLHKPQLQGILLPHPDGTFTIEDALLAGRANANEFLASFLTFDLASDAAACLVPEVARGTASIVCKYRDIMQSAPEDFRGLQCDAISLTIAFRAEPAALGAPMDAPLGQQLCAEAGATPMCPDGAQ